MATHSVSRSVEETGGWKNCDCNVHIVYQLFVAELWDFSFLDICLLIKKKKGNQIDIDD
ncbi:hypothetical protein OIU77_030826 [Salix suchowensis]|uniref:Uncharacterized protein n=1 Tax=Salix suchowensis TaxID=1278906 RepID=A0ABQ9BDC0_9ROSI|nr:hypothetical protein OIU77_030826 [Salix suchowensis]